MVQELNLYLGARIKSPFNHETFLGELQLVTIYVSSTYPTGLLLIPNGGKNYATTLNSLDKVQKINKFEDICGPNQTVSTQD